MVRQRIIAMRTNFYRYAGLWKPRHVSFQIRKTVFQSVISGAALSGCEPHVVPQCSGNNWILKECVCKGELLRDKLTATLTN